MNYLISMDSYSQVIIFTTIAIAFPIFLLYFIHKRQTLFIIPINWPIVGMLPHLLFNLQRFYDYSFEVLQQSDGGTFLFKGPWFSSMEMLLTINPTNVDYVMSKNFSNFRKDSKHVEIFDILGDGIFNAEFESWRYQRRNLHAFLNHSGFEESLVEIIRRKTEVGLIPILEHACKGGHVVDLEDLFKRFSFDTICILFMGHDPGSLSIELPDVPVCNALDDTEEVLFHRHVVPESIWKLERRLGIGKERKLMKAWETIDSFLYKALTMKIEGIRKKKNNDGIDWISLWFKEEKNVDQDLKPADLKFLRDMFINMLVAGRDSTSVALTWFFWLLFKNPSVEKILCEEIKSISSQDNDNFANVVQDDRKLAYVQGALRETLRLYPSLAIQIKTPIKPDILPSGHNVDPTTKVVISIYAMGRDASIWGDDCLEFKPDRWITKHGSIKHEPSYKFFAFNAGPRSCLGKNMALIEMKAIVYAIFVRGYHLQVVEEQKVEPRLSPFLHTKNGLKAKVIKASY